MRAWAIGWTLVLAGATASADVQVAMPEMLGSGTLSTADYERGITFSPDGQLAVTTIRIGVGATTVLVSARRRGNRWTDFQVMPFSGAHRDTDAVFSPDGRRLYFSSNRAADGESKGDADIFVVERTARGWGTPTPVSGLNSPGQELGLTMTPAGALYFSSSRAGRGDIFAAFRDANGDFTPPVALPSGINEAATAEQSAAVSPDGKLLLFASINRPDELLEPATPSARGDLYLVRWTDGRWGSPIHLPGPINTNAAELSPSFSADGRWLYFTSERGDLPLSGQPLPYARLRAGFARPGNGLGDLYRYPVAALETVR